MQIDIYPCENATEIIQQAIVRASENGGGKVVLNDGEYTIGSILLLSNVCLYLKSGAIVNASKSLEDYDLSALLKLPDGVDYSSAEHCPLARSGRGYVRATRSVDPFSRWSRALLKAYRAENVSVIGEKGALFDGHDLFDPEGEEQYRGPHFLNFHECENVHLQGYTIQNSGNWANAIFSSHQIVVEDLTVLGGHDGLDIMSCDDVWVKNCDFQTGDDCIAGFDNEVVLVENCKLNSSCNALRIGGNQFRVRNCEIYGPGKFGHRYGLSLEEKKKGVRATKDNARCNMESAINYYCDNRFAVRKPISLQVEDCTVEHCDKLVDYGFTDPKKVWVKNRPMESLCLKGITAKDIKGACELYAPQDVPLQFFVKDCKIQLNGNEFALYEHTDFHFENVEFVGKAPCLKGIDGSVCEIVQEKKDI